MAQYQRFLSYLFEYNRDEKKGNCGFVRVEIRQDVQRVFISVTGCGQAGRNQIGREQASQKQTGQRQANSLQVFGFYRRDSGCGCVLLGRMAMKNGRGQMQYVNNGATLSGSGISFEELSGIVAGVKQPFLDAYATVWDDKPFGLSMFDESYANEASNPKEAEEMVKKVSDNKVAEEGAKEISDVEATEESMEKASVNEAVKEDAGKVSDTEDVKESVRKDSDVGEQAAQPQVGAVPVKGEKKQDLPEFETCEVKAQEGQGEFHSGKNDADMDAESTQAALLWEKLSNACQHIETLPTDHIVCLKALPADIGRLPRQNWMLGSNGFLMYSYVKYRYIAFARLDGGSYELWIPGTFDRNEEFMAQLFGFYRFRSVKSQNAQAGDFGYWCVPLTLDEEAENNYGRNYR